MERSIGTTPITVGESRLQKIITHLWFDNQAEEAARFYVSNFKNSKVLNVSRYGEAGARVSGRPAGSAMTVAFQLDGQQFITLNGGQALQIQRGDLAPGELHEASGSR
jgi:predicted 3-demethylubiquinone-9 3-methyltransferase (glyoxalase superfamily)